MTEYIQNAPTQPLLTTRHLPISSFDKSQTRKKTKSKTRATAKKMTMMSAVAPAEYMDVPGVRP
jgi:hypothetical protein